MLEWDDENNAKIVSDSMQPIKIREMSTNIDIFAKHAIRSRRKSCLAYDNHYANKFLVQEYNDLFHSRIDMDSTNINKYDVEGIFYANHLAYWYKLVPELKMGDINVSPYNMRGGNNANVFMKIDLDDQDNTENILLPIFRESITAIRNEVIRITGARKSSKDKYLLEL